MWRLIGAGLVAWGIGACDVAELPPLRDARDAVDVGDTRDAGDAGADVTGAAETIATETIVDETEVQDDDVDVDVDGDADGDGDAGDGDAGDGDAGDGDGGDGDAGDGDAGDGDAEVAEVADDTQVADDTEVVDDTVVGDDGEVAEVGDEDVAACPMTIVETAPVASPHVPTCSAVTWATDPPTSGPHYPIWAEYKAYVDPVPRGFWVHNLEHGAVVVAYDCPGGCPEDVAALEAMIAARPVDPLCTLGGPPRRVVLTPDPLLTTRFAIVAWGVSLTADCLDPVAFGAFVDAHYGLGPEATCANGVDVTVPGLGTYCPPE